MENLSLVDMIKALTVIEKTLECIICLDSLKLPVLMCSNNHCVCSSCGKDLKGCPSCQTPLASNIRYPLAFENILKDMPGQCEFSEHCKQFMLGSELREHKKICRYRPILCKIVSCNWEGSLHTLLHHVKTEHQDCLIDNKDGVVVFYDFSPNELYYSVKLVVALNCLFWMYTKNDVTKRKYLVILTYLPLEVLDFTSEIKFATENLKYDYKLRVLNQDVNIDEILSRDYLLFIPSDLLSYFISDKNKLMYKINIIKNESVIKAQLTENKNDNDVKRILMKMDVLCPCCKNILKPPLNTCTNYHSFCYSCEVTTCPLCDSVVTSDRKYPTFVDNLLKTIEMKCKYSDNCKKVCDEESLVKHEKICKYRPVSCLILGCSKKIQLLDLCHHLKTNHSSYYIFNQKSNVELRQFNVNNQKYFFDLVKGEDSLFWMVVKHDIIQFKLFVFFIGLPLLDNLSMHSKLTFTNRITNEKYTYTIPVFEENSDINEIFNNENFTTISSQDLYPYIDSNSTLKYHFSIFDKNKIESL